jgi:hypothetical protein
LSLCKSGELVVFYLCVQAADPPPLLNLPLSAHPSDHEPLYFLKIPILIVDNVVVLPPLLPPEYASTEPQRLFTCRSPTSTSAQTFLVALWSFSRLVSLFSRPSSPRQIRTHKPLLRYLRRLSQPRVALPRFLQAPAHSCQMITC